MMFRRDMPVIPLVYQYFWDRCWLEGPTEQVKII